MAKKKTITAVDAVYILTVADLGIGPVQLQGFTADDVFSTDPIVLAETIMGVDRHMSAGFIPAIVKQKIHLQADSPSVPDFDTWYQQTQSAGTVYFASATVRIPALGKTFTMTNGVLKQGSVLTNVKKVLQPYVYDIDWESVTVSEG